MPRQIRTVACAECGTEFETAHHAAKFCSPAHRKAASRRPAKKGKRELAPDAAPVEVAPLDASARRGVVAGVTVELTQLELMDTVEGDLAIALAQGIDSPLDGISAKATAAKQLRDIMTELRRKAGTKADGLAGIEAAAETKLRLVK